MVFTFTFYTRGVRGGASHIGTRALASEEIMIVWMIVMIVMMIMGDDHGWSVIMDNMYNMIMGYIGTHALASEKIMIAWMIVIIVMMILDDHG